MICSTLIEMTSKLLKNCDEEYTNLAPTIFLNEGWMIRFLVGASIGDGLCLNGLDFDQMTHWYSEGLLASPFLPRIRGDQLAEGYTHADIVLGDIHVDVDPKADGAVTPKPPKGKIGYLGIIEAKMKSRLSPGTTHAPDYDQASRNLGCLAFNTLGMEHKIFLCIAAPEITLDKHKIREIARKEEMLEKIGKRFEMYGRAISEPHITPTLKTAYEEIYEKRDAVLERAASATCIVISYEDWLKQLKGVAFDWAEDIQRFYSQCLEYNRVE